MTLTIACLGAGPKGLAIALLAHALRRCGRPSVDVVLIERATVGANWAGQAGFTDGTCALNTSPFKDLGFPYKTGFGADVDRELGQYSFVEYLKARDLFVAWVCRGSFRATHRDFSAYLRWVSTSIRADVRCDEIVQIDPSLKRVGLTLRKGPPFFVDGVVISGPGSPRRLPVDGAACGRVFDGRDYWSHREWFDQISKGRVAVIGSGETAGSIVQSLIRAHPAMRLDIVNRHGFIPVQSAGYPENLLCTDPKQWCERSIEERKQVLHRIDRGVMSVDLKEEIDLCDRVQVRNAYVRSVRATKAEIVLRGAHDDVLAGYDAVIFAMGFDSFRQLQELLPDGGLDIESSPTRGALAVDRAFRLPDMAGNIHVPGLSGMSQGPGYPLLSCLGSVASRILEPYIDRRCFATKRSVIRGQTRGPSQPSGMSQEWLYPS